MVCKKEVCDWFKRLSSSKRLDLMCGLLHMCLPFELRFLGSCIEDLAKKDFSNLRDAEHKANNTRTLNQLSEDIDDQETRLFDQETRSKLILYLSLLYSHNTVCSNIMYDIVTRIHHLLTHCLQIQSSSSQQDERTSNIVTQSLADDVLLLLTSAANHPAFVFSQSQELHNHLRNVEKLLKDHNLLQPENCVSQSQSETEHSNSSSCSSNSSNSSSCSSSSSSNINSSVSSGPSSGHPSPANKQHGRCATPKPVHIKNIELKGSQWRNTDRRHEFLIQVTWSDGEVTETYRTYQDLHNFHTELIKLFPKDSGAHKQERHIPFLPQEKAHNKEMTEHLRKYIRQLSMLPEHMIQCEFMTTSFKGTPATHRARHHSRGSSAISPTPARVVGVADDDLNQGQGHIRGLTVYNSQYGEHNARRMAEQGLLVRSPRSSCIPTVTANTPLVNHRNTVYCTTIISSPSPHSSPLPSPLPSPNVSPSPSLQSEGGRSDSPRTGPEQPMTINKWLKKIRLHKYERNLSKYNWEKLLSLTDEELKREGLTQGACGKFRTEVEALRRNPGKNGLVELTDGSTCSATSSPSSPNITWHTPPSTSCYLPPHPPPHPQSRKPHYASSISITSGSVGSIDSSPSCSEYSSPPASPGPMAGKQRRDSYSSDEDTGKSLAGDLDQTLKLQEYSRMPRQHPRMPYQLQPGLVPPVPLTAGEPEKQQVCVGPAGVSPSAFVSVGVAGFGGGSPSESSLSPPTQDTDSVNGNTDSDSMSGNNLNSMEASVKPLLGSRPPVHLLQGMKPLMPGFAPGMDMQSQALRPHYAPYMQQQHFMSPRQQGNMGNIASGNSKLSQSQLQGMPMQMPMQVPGPMPPMMMMPKVHAQSGAPMPQHQAPPQSPIVPQQQQQQPADNASTTKINAQESGLAIATSSVCVTTLQLTVANTEAGGAVRKNSVGYRPLQNYAADVAANGSRPTSLGITASSGNMPMVNASLPTCAQPVCSPQPLPIASTVDKSSDAMPSVSCSVEVTVPYTIYPTAASTTTSNTVTYSSPTFHTTAMLSQPATGSTAGETTQSSPSPVTPLQTPTPSAPPTPSAATPPTLATVTQSNSNENNSTSNSCSSCGCNGQCSQSVPPNLSYGVHGMWPTGQMLPGYPPFPYMPMNSNEMINPNMPNLPYNQAAAAAAAAAAANMHHHHHHHPPFHGPMPNGFAPQHRIALLHAAAAAAANHPNGPPLMGHVPFQAGPPVTSQVPHNGKSKQSIPMCCNCGSSGHRREECKEATMDAMARSGQFHLNYARGANSTSTP